MISNKDIGEALLQNERVVNCEFLGKGIFLLRMEGDSYPRKMNSYGIMKVVDLERFNKEFSPRNFVVGMDELDLVLDMEDEQFCLEPPVRVAEEWEDDSIGELETSEDFDDSWEEVESDDGHRELYQDFEKFGKDVGHIHIKDKNLKFLFTRANGIGTKRNIAVEHSKTKYLAFLDSDAYPKKGWIESAFKLIKKIFP